MLPSDSIGLGLDGLFVAVLTTRVLTCPELLRAARPRPDDTRLIVAGRLRRGPEMTWHEIEERQSTQKPCDLVGPAGLEPATRPL